MSGNSKTAASLVQQAQERVELRRVIPFEWAPTITNDLDELREIVEGVFTAGGMSVIYGEPNSGKSTLMLDLAYRMPSGLPWLGRKTVKAPVIYIACEGGGSVRRRLSAYRQHHNCVVEEFGLISTTLNLMDPSADVEDLLDLIAGLELAQPVQLIVVDTVARAMGGANENAGEDMARLVGAGDRIREETGAHVAWVHHSGKDTAKGARGHSSLKAAVDTEIEVAADEGAKTHTLTITKQRDLDTKGQSFKARFLSVPLGMNQWGNPITANVVAPVDDESSHIAMVMRQVNNEEAEVTLVRGFLRLQTMGIDTTDAKNSSSYLPRQMLEKNIGCGFSAAELSAALIRLMVCGRFSRGAVGMYANRNKKTGLILSEITK